MNNFKFKAALALALSLAIGFAGGFTSKGLFDKQNAAKASNEAVNIPVHTVNDQALNSNELIAPHQWSIYLDPLFMPVSLAVPSIALPDFVSMPIDVPSVKTVDGQHELQVIAQLPGMTEKDVDVEAGTDIVTIKGHHKEESKDKSKFSTMDESFVRSVQLPCRVDGSKVKATLQNGVLTVSLPKVDDSGRKPK
jgi:HSP20 family molecular chaperone IbpA